VVRIREQPREQLLVDLAPAPVPAEAEMQAWAADQHVFVSSVMGSMTAERKAVVRAITTVGAQPVWFEAFGGMDDDPEDAYTAHVASSDIYLGILGARYGTPLKTGYSATHAEYNEAAARGLRISVWTTSAEQDGRQRDFLDEVRVFHTTGTYMSSDDLAQRVERRLRTLAANALTQWVKVGNTVFRATRVHDDGRTITIVGRVRDNTVAASLEVRRSDVSYGRNSETRITWSGGTSLVRVKTVVSETASSSRVREITLTADRTPESRSGLLEMAVGNRTPEDLTELAARVAFLGEPNPSGHDVVHGERHEPVPNPGVARPARGCRRAGRAPARHRTARRRARRGPHHIVPSGAEAGGSAAASPRVEAPQAIHERRGGRAVHPRGDACWHDLTIQLRSCGSALSPFAGESAVASGVMLWPG
jgi:hypothetical protein